MSTAESTWAGSRLVMSLDIPKRKVWSAARVSDDPPPPPPHAATTDSAPNAAARERNLELPVIQPPQETKPRRALKLRCHPRHPSPSSRRSGARVRRQWISPSRDGTATPRSYWGLDPLGVKFPRGQGSLAARWPARRACHDRSMSMVGVGRRRLEGGEKVTGATRFTADIELAGLLHVQLVLSQLASARIRSIDTGAAKSAPGVFAVFTGADLAASSASGPDQPLAVDRVFYMGQPVAAVIAVSEAAAADAAALIEVDLEALSASIDAESAMKEGTAAVLEAGEEASEEDAAIHGAATKSEAEPARRPPNVTAVSSLKRGHVVPALAGADVVVKQTYRLAGVHHSPMEPHVSIARPEPDGGMTIWAPTQGPFQVREEISKLLEVPAPKVHVVPMPVGGGFGGKVSLLEAVLALLARRTGRPLRLALT